MIAFVRLYADLFKNMTTIADIFERGVVEINGKDELKKKLESGQKLRVKFGIDPTGNAIHLGHTVPLRKLRQFQELGHHVILLFGTFTGKIGDPTGKDKLRKLLTDEDIAQNMETYLEQAGKIIDIKNVEVVQNGDWLSAMNFEDVLRLAGCYTVSQMLQRDMFQKRISENKEINLVEFMYPLMQGYDSVALRADIEIGGTDQLFNMMAGRQIQERFGQSPQAVITVPLMEGLDGHEKMSKSLGNYVGVLEEPRNIFGKLMSIPDTLMPKYFELLTKIPKDEQTLILQKHPKEAKMQLAFEITKDLTNAEQAEKTKEEFIRIFSADTKEAIPDNIPEIHAEKKEYTILELATMSGLFPSNKEAKRKIAEGAFRINAEKKTDEKEIITLDKETIVQVGKKSFCKITI